MKTHHALSKFLWIVVLVLLGRDGPAQPVALDIQNTGSYAVLSWSGSNFVVQTAADLSTHRWQNLTAPLADPGGHLLAVPFANPQAFFRLVQSPFLAPPTGLRVIVDEDRFYLDWDAVTNAVAYNLYISTRPDVGPADYELALSGIPETDAVLTNLVAGVPYYFVTTASDGMDESASSGVVSAIFGPNAEVHGSVYAELTLGTNLQEVFLAGVNLSLSLPGSNNPVATVTSDASGDFVFAAQPAGVYQLCWTAPGYVSDCSTQQVIISNITVFLPPQEIVPVTNAGAGLVFGRVTFADGSGAFAQDAFFDVSANPVVQLTTLAGQVLRSTAPNDAGYFVFAGVPLGTNLLLTAQVEGAQAVTNIDTSVVGEADLVIPNSPPHIQQMAAYLNGQLVRRVPAGATVLLTVTATDPDNDPLHYEWLPGTEDSTFVSQDATNVLWTVPNTNGLHIMYVRVNDNKGGYDTAEIALAVNDGLIFAGQVSGSDFQVITNADSTLLTNAPPVTNALVTVNGQATLTDDAGYFEMIVTNESPQYLLRIQKTGYAPLALTYFDEAPGGFYLLLKAQELCTNLAPGLGVSLTDNQGTTIRIPADSLFSTNGAPLNPVCFYLTTIDPCAPDSPLAVNSLGHSGGTNYFLTGLAGVDIEAVDAASAPLQLAPGAMAQVSAAVGPLCLMLSNGLPVTAPSWIEDSAGGGWQQLDTATLTNGGPVLAYNFATPLLGFLAAADAEPQTVTLNLIVDKTLNRPLVARVSGDGFLLTKLIFEADNPNNEVTVPANKPVKIQVLNLREAPGDFYYEAKGGTAKKNDADKTVIAQADLTPAKDQDVVLGLSLQIANLKASRVGNTEHFLTFKASTSLNKGAQFNQAEAYYAVINAGNKGFLQPWLIANGFLDAQGKNYQEDAAAIFFNASDLGFGRSMHMRKRKNPVDNNWDIAYYVSNHPTVEHALTNGNRIATVAMDYAYDPKYKKRYTKFYAFNETDRLAKFANLDDNGAKYMPNLCIVCHGGKIFNYDPKTADVQPADGDLGANFIPFDPASYTYSAKFPQKDLLPQFDALNDGILLTDPPDADAKLVAGLKGNGFKTFVPDGWKTEPALYQSVVAVSCRSCHVTRPAVPLGTFDELKTLSTGTKDKPSRAETLVCRALKMPNAQRTFSIFWGSAAANKLKPGVTPDQPNLLKAKFNWGDCPTANP